MKGNMDSAEGTHEERTYAMRDYYLLTIHSYLYDIVSVRTLYSPYSIPFYPTLLFLLYIIVIVCPCKYISKFGVYVIHEILITSHYLSRCKIT